MLHNLTGMSRSRHAVQLALDVALSVLQHQVGMTAMADRQVAQLDAPRATAARRERAFVSPGELVLAAFRRRGRSFGPAAQQRRDGRPAALVAAQWLHIEGTSIRSALITHGNLPAA